MQEVLVSSHVRSHNNEFFKFIISFVLVQNPHLLSQVLTACCITIDKYNISFLCSITLIEKGKFGYSRAEAL